MKIKKINLTRIKRMGHFSHCYDDKNHCSVILDAHGDILKTPDGIWKFKIVDHIGEKLLLLSDDSQISNNYLFNLLKNTFLQDPSTKNYIFRSGFSKEGDFIEISRHCHLNLKSKAIYLNIKTLDFIDQIPTL